MTDCRSCLIINMRILLDGNQEIGAEENVCMLMCDKHVEVLNCDVRCLINPLRMLQSLEM
jgi:hypothetical protein